ncbi:MAG: hypothetical protein IPG73_06690 [Ignavibacteria bacterium]|nr:hypothetical protein [Ignavibacteria bacterium]MBK7411835.1 hypothetical protein [Ignavibacteria bacterium]
MEPLTPEEIAARHRYMAVEANNLAWQLSIRERTPDEDLEMLNAAHASAWHWSIVGTELNHMRATMLLAEVHALCGMGQTAYAYARKMYGYFSTRETEAWELAFAHAIHARAAHAAGRIDDYRASYAHAVELIGTLSDEDRPIVEMTFKSIPKPPTIA